MKIEFSVPDKPDDWLTTIGQILNVPVINNAVVFPASLGEGYFKHYNLFEWLTLKCFYFKGNQPLELLRNGRRSSSLIIITFYNQELVSKQYINGQPSLIGYHTPNGVFMPSPEITTRWVIPPHIRVSQVSLVFDRELMLKSLLNQDSFLGRLLKCNEGFYLFESLTPQMYHLIGEIIGITGNKENLQNLLLQQKSMELLNLFFHKVDSRLLPEQNIRLNQADIERVFSVRKMLSDNLTNLPPLKQLSIEAGMSVSKLQKCFRQVFGKSISEYALTEKMEMARQMLAGKKYSVSEVGYQLGYSNMSHFTKAFNRQFGINPKDFLSSL